MLSSLGPLLEFFVLCPAPGLLISAKGVRENKSRRNQRWEAKPHAAPLQATTKPRGTNWNYPDPELSTRTAPTTRMLSLVFFSLSFARARPTARPWEGAEFSGMLPAPFSSAPLQSLVILEKKVEARSKVIVAPLLLLEKVRKMRGNMYNIFMKWISFLF